MELEKQQQLQEHVRAIAALLYDETPDERLTTLEGLEQTVRAQVLEHVTPEIGRFLSQP